MTDERHRRTDSIGHVDRRIPGFPHPKRRPRRVLMMHSKVESNGIARERVPAGCVVLDAGEVPDGAGDARGMGFGGVRTSLTQTPTGNGRVAYWRTSIS
ncbi:hypothetical protein ACO2Q2_13190 [Dyella sp. KRB-257]|uniref:hypothetical protein n=1 Tax=Dyella sp. KRB-257 TaxID=3400915 RepID=UPI003BFF5A80